MQPIEKNTLTERLAPVNPAARTAAKTVGGCLPDLFEAQVDRSPRATAFVFGENRFTYAELDAAANRVARLLIARGVGPGNLVGLLLARSPELMIGLLGVIKAGAAYLPLDPDYPAARLKDMLQDGGVAQVLTTGDISGEALQGESLPTVLLDQASTQSELMAYPETRVTNEDRVRPLQPDDLLYVIYTSGSTGRPKGVAIEHRSFTHFMQCMLPRFRMEEGSTLLALSTICFDPAGMEIFLPLLQGGCSVMLSGMDSRDPVRVVEAVEHFHIDMVDAVPTFWRAMIASGISRRVRVLLCGEAVPSAMVPSLLEFPEAYNMYGPTETTVVSTCYRIVPEDIDTGPVVTLGQAFEGEEFYILDEQRLPVEGDSVGELYISGIGLARGYFNRPELTAERFVDCPFGAAGGRMYKTGDLARWRRDGNVEYLGRSDQQVKIRGYRIELGEIESTILRLAPAIKECTVTAQEIRGQAHLVAYHVNLPGTPVPEVHEIRTLLAAYLPDHMIPRIFKRLDRMPLAPNGKLDRLSLPKVDEVSSRQVYRAPVGSAEVAICRIFREMTGAPRVGRDDDFFALGGTSLAAVLCIHRLRREFDQPVTLRQLFKAPTPWLLAQSISRGDTPVATDAATSHPYPTIFLLPGMGGDEPQLVRFRMEWEGIARIVPLDYSDWRDLLGRKGGMEILTRDFLRSILKEAPTGPIWLLGYSLGGNCAHAVALNLTEHGREVAFVGLFDAEANPELSEVLAAELQSGVGPSREAWHILQDLGRVIRALYQGEFSRAVALALVRRLTTPWAMPLLARASSHRRWHLPVTLGYHLNAYMNEARQVAAVQEWSKSLRETPRQLSVPAVLFRSQSHQPGDADDLGWERYFPQLEVMHLPGTHKTMFEPPHLKTLCERTRAVIDAVFRGAFSGEAVRS